MARKGIGISMFLGLVGVSCMAGVGGPAGSQPDGGIPPNSDTANPTVNDGAANDRPAPPISPDATAPGGDSAPDPSSGLNAFVYAHTSGKLYSVNPETLAVSLVGAFFQRAPGAATTTPVPGVTDIAVDRAGAMVGVTFTQFFRIDRQTAECTGMVALDSTHRFNGLSWVTVGNTEALLATALDGAVWRIDPVTGAATSVGSLGNGLKSSGDLVSVAKYGTLITVVRPSDINSDWLARLDPATGQATLIGAVGFRSILGIGFWKDRVFGFNDAGQFILINPDTGAGTMVSQLPGISWWGAGVTTSVFVVP